MLGKLFCQYLAGRASSQDHYAVHLYIVLAHILEEHVHAFSFRDDEHKVMILELGVKFRDDGFILS